MQISFLHLRRNSIMKIININLSRLVVVVLWSSLLVACSDDGQQRKVLGAVEVVELKEAKLSFVGRVDTGARRTSIHALDIKVDEGVVLEEGASVTGLPISFTVFTKDGQSKRVETIIDKIVFVRTSEGGEYRYVVPLSFSWQGVTKTIQVTLNDRSRMSYRLLLGRNWITKDFVVNVDK